jgi:beta-glucosidase
LNNPLRSRTVSSLLCHLALGCLVAAAHGQHTDARPWMDATLPAEQRAELVLQQMTLSEKIALLHGNGMAHASQWQMPLTAESNGGAGMVEGVERLGIPRLYLSDAAYGVRSSGENGRYSTALPSNLASASSWDPEGACEYGALIGRELRAQGYNMTLGGGVNLTRDPRNGRTFEYLGEDPLLAGTLDGNLMRCEQAEHVVGDIKHYALNDQETGRNIVDVKISQRAMQESDLLAFHIALDLAKPGAVMCSYNRINGDYACENRYLLHDVLKRDWHFPGFVLSDWGGTHSTEKASAAGLDQEQPMAKFFGAALEKDAADGQVPLSEIDDHARRILYAEFLSGIVDAPVQKSVVDAERGLEIAQRQEEASIVLLRNEHQVLPLLASRVKRIALIGGHADVGMISGGGSAQVDPPGGNAILPPGKGLPHWQAHIWFPTSPLKALRAQLPGVEIDYASGDDRAAAAALARNADVVLVFATQWSSEGIDLPSLALPDAQDNLVEAMAEANPHTVVVLETGTAVTMPWLNRVEGVVEAWYGGSSGHRALARILTGDVNPSGKLPMTFPRTEADLPHAVIAPLPKEDRGQGSAAVNDVAHSQSRYSVTYDEGLKVGYKWYQAEDKQPLFPFGFGLSYTTFAYSGIAVSGDDVTFTVRNTGSRAGVEIAQVYATPPAAAAEPFRHLAGWQRVRLAPGESKQVTVRLDRRALSVFEEASNSWSFVAGSYTVEAGSASDALPLKLTQTLR